MIDKLQYTKAEAAEQLSISVASLDVLIARGEIKIRRMGARVFVPQRELLHFASRDFVGPIWPEKVNGKTVRPSKEQ